MKSFLEFTYLHKTQPGLKAAGNFPNIFEEIYLPDVLVSRFGCRFKYLMVSRSYGLSKTDERLNLKNTSSGREAMVMTIVIVVRAILESQVFAFPIVLAIVLVQQFPWFKIQ